MEAKQDDAQLGDDLFDFDGLLREIDQDADELGAAFDAVLETTSDAPDAEFAPVDPNLFAADAPQPEPAAPLPAPTHRVRPTPPPLGAVEARPVAPAPLLVHPVPRAAPALLASPAASPSRRFTLSPALIVVLLAVVAVNLGLVVLLVRAISAVQSTVVDVGQQVLSTAESVREQASTRPADDESAALPAVEERPEGLETLERAQGLLADGAYERARQTLFALLAVIDRVPPEVRTDVEARARFLLADSWRLEADALERIGEPVAELTR